MKSIYFLILLTVLILGCSDNEPVSETTHNERKITKAEYGEKWPFTVEEGILKCINDGVIFTVNRKSYGINGRAKTDGYADPQEIWAVDSSLSDAYNTLRKDIQPIIDDGRKMCN
jgi:hypothetical protein